MAQALGGEVEATGHARVRRNDGKSVDDRRRRVCSPDLARDGQVWMSHGDAVDARARGVRVTGATDAIPVAAMEDPARGLFAVQFHPEVAHTPDGQDVLKRFLYEGCGLLPEWTPTNVIERAVERIRARSATPRSCARSPAASTRRSPRSSSTGPIGEQLTCVFVDHRPEPRGRAASRSRRRSAGISRAARST